MKCKIGIVIAVILILVVPLVTVGCGPSTTITTTSVESQTWTDFNNVNSVSLKSLDGLTLSLSLDSTTYKPGQTVRMVIDEHNPLSTTVDVPVSDNWTYDYLTMGGCGTNGGYFGIAIFKGSYTSANISEGTPLPFWNYSITTACPTTTTPPNGYHFQPLDDAFVEMSFLNGYWSGNPTAKLKNFIPGVYTIVAGDEWGASVFLHFTITR
jgi:hypothetical protein